jgi:hypothetical protein
MEIPDVWRHAQAHHATTAQVRPGQPQQAPPDSLAITDIVQQCQNIIPILHLNLLIDAVTVTVTSGRPGVGGQVTVGVNLNSFDGSYQGPVSIVGQGQFTATNSQFQTTFTIWPDQWPMLGVGAWTYWDDGAPKSFALEYKDIACGWPWWWRLLVRLLRSLRLAPRP